ncbi:hypothetical protein [Brevundimonas naejangsanensis]|uniref:hypothetical protein n=1 Tax=Brevundimonas naejangsanensis TaxID=588932 RepID=UPI0026ECCE0B|nr:hypothetical protein [Brevundimonas naejangsanensis]
MGKGALTAEDIVAGYEVLFDPLMRAAHRACFERANLTRPERWPTVSDCLAFAKLYGVDAPELAAFFGHLCWGERGRTVWVDALRGDLPTWEARQRSTRGQAIAFGFQRAFSETVRSDRRLH